MPAMNNLLSRWVPVEERSRSLALVYSGMYLGSVTGLAFSPGLIHKFTWSSVFFTFGSLGTLWFASWQKFVKSLSLLQVSSVLILLNFGSAEPAKVNFCLKQYFFVSVLMM
jgi:ACS family sodium-dependent inorganic phosphate cotransporter